MSKNRNSFTMIELLVVIAILSVLSAITFGQFRSSQTKARDSQRKADLGNIQRGLEMYYNDYGLYPLSTDDGQIDIWSWGSEFVDDEGTVYMKKLPTDPADDYTYCYYSADGTDYYLYSILENEKDPNYGEGYACGVGTYNWFAASPNADIGGAPPAFPSEPPTSTRTPPASSPTPTPSTVPNPPTSTPTPDPFREKPTATPTPTSGFILD